MTSDGQLCLHLRHRWADGTTQLVFDPGEFLARLAVLVPRPRINLVRYHGVLGPRAAWRAAVVPRRTAPDEAPIEDTHDQAGPGATDADTTGAAPRLARGRLWADPMRRTFGFDVLACPRCGGRLGLIASIDQAQSVNPQMRADSLVDGLVAEHRRFAALDDDAVHPGVERLGRLWDHVAERRTVTREAPLSAKEVAHARTQFEGIYDALVARGRCIRL